MPAKYTMDAKQTVSSGGSVVWFGENSDGLHGVRSRNREFVSSSALLHGPRVFELALAA